MKTNSLPEGYRVEEIPLGCRQYFPGGFREYQKFRGAYACSTTTDGRSISHEALDKIFQNTFPFHDPKFGDGNPRTIKLDTAPGKLHRKWFFNN